MSSHRSLTLAAAALSAAALCGSDASAAVVYLQDVDGNSGFTFEGTAVTDAIFDDGVVATGSTSIEDDQTGASGSMAIRTTSTGLIYRGVLAIKDMFTLLPITSGTGNLQINSATLHLAASNGKPADFTLTIRRITTDWLANSPGSNETRVSGKWRNAVTPGANLVDGQRWANGGNFSASDYTTVNAVNNADFETPGEAYGAYYGFDVTGIVQDIYSAGQNYGFLISTTLAGNAFVNIRSSNDTILPATHETFRPVLEIDYTYIPVPEPASWGLLAAAALLVVGRRRA